MQQLKLDCALQRGEWQQVAQATADALTAESPSIVDLVLAALALQQQGKLNEALPFAAKAAEMEAIADRAPRASGRAVYGDVLRESGRVTESRAVLEAALDYWQTQRERDGVQMNPRLAMVQLALARTLQQQAQDPARQAELLRSALDIRRRVMGPTTRGQATSKPGCRPCRTDCTRHRVVARHQPDAAMHSTHPLCSRISTDVCASENGLSGVRPAA